MSYVIIDPVASKSKWPWVELRRVADNRRVPNTGSNRELLSLSAHTGVQARPEDGGRQLPSAETVANYWQVEPNDLVFNPMWAIEGGVAVSTLAGAVSTAYRVYALRDVIYPRFAHYYFRSSLAIAQYRLLVRGVTTFDRSVTRDDFEAMPTPVPPLAQQRAIADYLDAETARIDALIAKKQQLIHLLGVRWNTFLAETLAYGASVRVRHVTSLRTSGPRGWGDRVAETGRPFVRSANLTENSIDLKLADLAYVDPPRTAEAFRSTVRTGDSLVGITGANTGWVAHASETVSGGFVSQHVAILRPVDIHPRWLTYALAAPQAREQLLGGQYGGTKTQLGLDELANLNITAPSQKEQAARVGELDKAYERTQDCVRLMKAQLQLLSDRRSAVVAEAVTGSRSIELSQG